MGDNESNLGCYFTYGVSLFSNIIFLVIVLLLISFTPMGNGNDWFASAPLAFLLGMGVYGLLLAAIYLQSKLFKKAYRRCRGSFLLVTNLALITFLAFYHFIIAGHRAFPDSTALIALFSLLLYFFGLIVFYVTSYEYIPASTRDVVRSAWDYGWRQIRLIFPFTIPFLLLSFILDLTKFFPSTDIQQILFHKGDNLSGALILFVITVLFLTLMMIFFPPLIQAIWRCKPIKDLDLLERLEGLCRKARFRHAGMKTWTVMNHSYTAGIVGILPGFRYVMFTQLLLDEMPPECIEAILAHEIGHSYRKHLLIYPFIIFGMLVCTGLFSLFFSESIDEFFFIQHLLHPSPAWKALYPFMIFLPYAFIIAVYFRFVFGYFSRIFERQADLHVFELGVPSEHMQQAFDNLATLTGNTHHHPSWHHHSINKRIDFLTKAAADPNVIAKHHRRVKRDLIIYFNLLAFVSILLVSPLISGIPPFRQLTNFSLKASQRISDWFSSNLHKRLAEQYVERYQLRGNIEKISDALTESIKDYASVAPAGVVEYVAAKALFTEGEVPASIKLLTTTWETFDMSLATPEVIEEFSSLTDEILQQYPGRGSQKLQKSYNEAIQRWQQGELNDIQPRNH